MQNQSAWSILLLSGCRKLRITTGRKVLLMRFSVCALPGSPGPKFSSPVFSPVNAGPNAFMKIINSKFYSEIDDTDKCCITKALIQRALGGASENDKEDYEHYSGSQYPICKCLDQASLRAVPIDSFFYLNRW